MGTERIYHDYKLFAHYEDRMKQAFYHLSMIDIYSFVGYTAAYCWWESGYNHR